MSAMVEYLGRMVAEEGFRAFIYAIDNRQKLVNSWKEFEAHMASGEWFPSKEDAVIATIPKPIEGLRKKGRD